MALEVTVEQLKRGIDVKPGEIAELKLARYTPPAAAFEAAAPEAPAADAAAPAPPTAPPQPKTDWTCHTIEGPHFAFDSSFLGPKAAASLAAIAAALDGDPTRKALLFGHTDEVGSEDYNKLLSERRARSVFAFLTHDLDAWRDLATKESWGYGVVQEILEHLGKDVGLVRGHPTSKTIAAVKAFQTEKALAPDGDAGKETRRALYKAYMESVHPAPIAKGRFALNGFMGCSQFNPIVDTKNPEERNRRVIAFVFTPDAAPKALPCKLADVKPCHASFKPGTGTAKTFRCGVFADLVSKCDCHDPPDPDEKPIVLSVSRISDDHVKTLRLVAKEGDVERLTIEAAAALDKGNGVRAFTLAGLEDAKTYRLELVDAELGAVRAWQLSPGTLRKSLARSDPSGDDGFDSV